MWKPRTTRGLRAALALGAVTMGTWVIVSEGQERLHHISVCAGATASTLGDGWPEAFRVSHAPMDAVTVACAVVLLAAWYRYFPDERAAGRASMAIVALLCWLFCLPALT